MKRGETKSFNFSPLPRSHLAAGRPENLLATFLLLPGDGAAPPPCYPPCYPSPLAPLLAGGLFARKGAKKKMCGDRNSRASRGVGGGKCHLLSRGGEINSRRGRGREGVRAEAQVMGVARVHVTGAALPPVDCRPRLLALKQRGSFFPPPPFQRLTDSLVFYSAAAS